MTADLLSTWWVHTVSVERYTGTGAYGDTFATPADVTGFVADGQRLVAGIGGQQVTSTATVYLPATTADVPIKSKVTLPAVFGGREAQVVRVARHDAGALPLPECLELNLV